MGFDKPAGNGHSRWFQNDFNEPSRSNMEEVLEPDIPLALRKDCVSSLSVDGVRFIVTLKRMAGPCVSVGARPLFRRKKTIARLTGDGVKFDPVSRGVSNWQ